MENSLLYFAEEELLNEAKKNALNFIAENLISASEYDDDLGYILRDGDVNIKVDLED